MKPALTAEEWAVIHRDGCLDCYTHDKKITVSEFVEPEDVSRHGLAALCLDGQPFGFTREDFADIRNAAKRYQNTVANVYWDDDAMRLLRLADRIEALLPPSEPQAKTV